MTTTVIVHAHCPEDTEAEIILLDTPKSDPEHKLTIETHVIQNDKVYIAYVSDTQEVYVRERRKNR